MMRGVKHHAEMSQHAKQKVLLNILKPMNIYFINGMKISHQLNMYYEHEQSEF